MTTNKVGIYKIINQNLKSNVNEIHLEYYFIYERYNIYGK